MENMEKPDISSLSLIQKVQKAAEFILESEGNTSPSKTISGKNLREKIKKGFTKEFSETSDNTLAQYLSVAAKDSSSRVNSAPGRKGYYLLSEAAISSIQTEGSQDFLDVNSLQQEETNEGLTNLQREATLYPLLRDWLLGKDYLAKDVSAGKKNGTWGNPDVLGARITQTIVGENFELLSVEAKISLSRWKVDIFEAISHRRFVNRSYFAFAHSEETREKLPLDELQYFSELYKVGILAVFLSDRDFQSITSGNSLEIQDPDSIDIVDMFPAPFCGVQPEKQFAFLSNLQINSVSGLMKFFC